MLKASTSFSSKSIKSQLENTKALLDLIANYQSTYASKPVCQLPKPSPLNSQLPKHPRDFSQVLNEVQEKILPNNINFSHPMFFAFFPFTHSYSAFQGELLAKALGSVAFTKSISPASYEIEMLVSDWLSEMLDLPKHFYNKIGPGGGISYSTASDSTLTAMSCARLEKPGNPVVYTSDQAHFSIEKAARVLGIPIRIIPSYFNEKIENYSIDVQKLKDQISKDKAAGFTPAMIVGCIGGTNVCSIDDNEELGLLAQSEKMWFHIDAAYAGSFGILPEFRFLLKGVEHCTTFNINSSKMLLGGMNSSHMWVKDKVLFIKNLAQNSNYLPEINDVDLKNWQIPLGRECKALKSWFVIQEYGEEGLREHLRKYIEAAKVAEEIVKADARLEMVVKRLLSLVVFRVKGENVYTDELVKKLAQNENIFLLGSKIYDKSIVRFTPGNFSEGNENIHEAFRIIFSYLD